MNNLKEIYILLLLLFCFFENIVLTFEYIDGYLLTIKYTFVLFKTKILSGELNKKKDTLYRS